MSISELGTNSDSASRRELDRAKEDEERIRQLVSVLREVNEQLRAAITCSRRMAEETRVNNERCRKALDSVHSLNRRARSVPSLDGDFH